MTTALTKQDINDTLIKKVKDIEIECLEIRHQLEEHDKFSEAAYKVMVIKIQALESELNKVKKVLQIA